MASNRQLMRRLLQCGMLLALMLASGVVRGQTNAAPLPDVNEVIAKMAERAKRETENDHQFKERYQYTRAKVVEWRNLDGDLKKRTERVSTNTPSLKPKPAKSVSKPTSRKAATDDDDKAKAGDESLDKEDFLMVSNITNRFDFELVGREELAGRSMLVVEVKPANRKRSEGNIKERVINRTAGRIWVDEEDYTVVKADLHLTEGFGLWLLVGVRTATFGFERERTSDGLWFTRDMKWEVQLREVILERRIDCHETKKDVVRQTSEQAALTTQ